jgi:cytochrome c5
MHRGWTAVFLGVFVVIVVSACGRVNLEDLTPEAVRTQMALTPSTTSGGGNGTPGATSESGADASALAAGDQLYNTWCTGCHDTGRLGAPVIKGNTYDPAEWIPILRAPGDPSKHPSSYTEVEVSDAAYQNIFLFLAHQ